MEYKVLSGEYSEIQLVTAGHEQWDGNTMPDQLKASA